MEGMYGKDHGCVAHVLHNLALVRIAQGNLSAGGTQRKGAPPAQTHSRRVPPHPSTRRRKTERTVPLALCTCAGRLEEARGLLLRASDIRHETQEALARAGEVGTCGANRATPPM